LQFTFMFGVMLLTVLAGTYFFVKRDRTNVFYSKLDDRAVTAAQFYLAEDNFSKEKFKKILDKFPQILPKEVIRIYNDDLQPKFISEGSVHWSPQLLKSVTAHKKLHLTQQDDRQVTGIDYADNSGNYIIMVSAVDESGHRYLHEMGLVMTVFFFVSLFVTFLIGTIFSRFALSPIVYITDELKRIRASSLNLRLPVDRKKNDEIDSLSFTINHLLEHLQQSFESQKSFVANASHELRTPITTMLGEAEITLMHDRSAEEYKAVLANIIKETERLNYIINSLMELIQTSVESSDFEQVNIDELFWDIKDELAIRNPESCIDIELHLPGDAEMHAIPGNRQLLFIAVTNIIKNAIKFSDNKAVHCTVFCNKTGLNVKVSDKGIGISQKDMAKIFQPFFRSANAISYPGYGIGLALTQNIIRLHNGTVKVESEVNRGTNFLITFPLQTQLGK